MTRVFSFFFNFSRNMTWSPRGEGGQKMTSVMQRPSAALLCMVILGALSLAAAAEGANVLVLTADNFDQAVKDHPFLGMSTVFL